MDWKSAYRGPMTRHEWLNEFAKELVSLRPHLGDHFARTIAMVSIGSTGVDYDPTKAAREYHMRREGGDPRALKPKKRPT